jgi:hypothetical protein
MGIWGLQDRSWPAEVQGVWLWHRRCYRMRGNGVEVADRDSQKGGKQRHGGGRKS